MKQKMIFLFALLIGMDVQAMNYTEYEFAGYQESIPMIDEFTKYEPQIIHKYYSLKEGESFLIKEDDPSMSEYDRCSVYGSETIYTVREDPKYDKHKLFRALKPYKTTALQIEYIDPNVITITDLDITIEGKKLDIKIEEVWDGMSDKIIIPLDEVEIETIEFTVYYEANDYTQLTFKLEGGGSYGFGLYDTVSPQWHSCHFFVKNKENYEEFIKEHNFSSQKFTQFFTYEAGIYSCFNYEKEYKDEISTDKVEDLLYDELEDITIYKVFKRERLEDQIVSIPDNSTSSLSAHTPSRRPIVVTKVPQDPIELPEEKEEDRDFKEIAIVDKVDDDLQETKEESNRNETCEYEEEKLKKIKNIKSLLLIIFIISILRFAYDTCVKKTD